MPSPDYSAARRHLIKIDPKLAAIIKRVGPCRLHSVAPADAFEALTMSIASQQLSVKAADTIFRRFCDLFPPDRRPTPARVMRQLVAVKGIGVWTAEIFLMFRLGRPDILPADGQGVASSPLRRRMVPAGKPRLVASGFSRMDARADKLRLKAEATSRTP